MMDAGDRPCMLTRTVRVIMCDDDRDLTLLTATTTPSLYYVCATERRPGWSTIRPWMDFLLTALFTGARS